MSITAIMLALLASTILPGGRASDLIKSRDKPELAWVR